MRGWTFEQTENERIFFFFISFLLKFITFYVSNQGESGEIGLKQHGGAHNQTWSGKRDLVYEQKCLINIFHLIIAARHRLIFIMHNTSDENSVFD